MFIKNLKKTRKTWFTSQWVGWSCNSCATRFIPATFFFNIITHKFIIIFYNILSGKKLYHCEPNLQIYSEILKVMSVAFKGRLEKLYLYQKQSLGSKGVLRSFVKFTEKHLYLVLIKLQAIGCKFLQGTGSDLKIA